MGLELWTYGLRRILSPSDPNVFSRPQTSRSKNVTRFYDLLDPSSDSGENDVLFVKIGAKVLDMRLDKFFQTKIVLN